MPQVTDRKQSRPSRLYHWPLLYFGLFAGCSNAPDDENHDPVSLDSQITQQNHQIEQFCGYCHAMPDPSTFPREAWSSEVKQGFQFYYDNPVEGLPIPDLEATVAYFEQRADVNLDAPVSEVPDGDSLFVATQQQGQIEAIAISNIRFSDTSNEIWACDMWDGTLFRATRGEPLSLAARPVQLLHPCRSILADLDRDGSEELLVSDLGSFLPQDHQFGAVWSFSPRDDWSARPILQNIGRVSDVQSGDLDQDGDLDLVVAEFGWRRTGKIHILWNDDPLEAVWRSEILDDRHGAIDVPVVDINGDGLLDIVALVAQEFEQVDAYINTGSGAFERQTIYSAGDPSYGSSGIQMVDLDLDGDVDVLHTNGDSFDTGHIKPYHGIRWLENQGEFPFVVHELAAMAGVHRAVAGDIDRDGDLDIAAVGLLPPVLVDLPEGLASVIWLEHVGHMQYERHVVEIDQCQHASCELVDWDGDDDLDLLVSQFRWGDVKGPPMTVFENRLERDELSRSANAPDQTD